eukprot:CAMPEP_0181257592 /NCGR_PEP_ID=MMETSP1096-20121128/50327_1 /TAXON_ID=156174 ORGANISM="Chrysochromulina ericina, Strain CCMP281" /NCGR_SAMPLE_ID=MMETSP1096 /ASSEMBLY_ACC=CAM_ASM_000453 /LENGTH=119 /DNA_ID=CAMNT_0023355921 /DNA_START=143 /DNA_END=502 /DNA_ORIENTATION=-
MCIRASRWAMGRSLGEQLRAPWGTPGTAAGDGVWPRAASASGPPLLVRSLSPSHGNLSAPAMGTSQPLIDQTTPRELARHEYAEDVLSHSWRVLPLFSGGFAAWIRRLRAQARRPRHCV